MVLKPGEKPCLQHLFFVVVLKPFVFHLKKRSLDIKHFVFHMSVNIVTYEIKGNYFLEFKAVLFSMLY